MPRSLAIVFFLAAAGLTLSFQNCSSTMASALLSGGIQSSSAAPAVSTGNGQGYDGMTAATYMSATKAGASCADGTQVNAKIKIVSSKEAYTLRVNCVDITPQKIAASELQKVPGFKKYIIYKSAVYKTDSTSPTADLICVPSNSSSATSVMITPDGHAQFATSQTNSGDFVVDLASGSYVGKDSAGDAFTLTIVSQGIGSLTIVPANSTSAGAAVPMTCYQ